MKSVTWQPVSCGSYPLFSSWYIRTACMFTRLKSWDRDWDVISSRPRSWTLKTETRPRCSIFPNSRDWDETRCSKKTSRDRLETETFKTETTSLHHCNVLISLICADVLLRNYSLTHSLTYLLTHSYPPELNYCLLKEERLITWLSCWCCALLRPSVLWCPCPLWLNFVDIYQNVVDRSNISCSQQMS